MIFFFGIGICLAWVLLKVFQMAPENPVNAWPLLKNKAGSANPKKPTRAAWLAARWWANPGWVVKKLSIQSIVKTLPQSFMPLNVREFYSVKQGLWSAGVLLLLGGLWFSDLSLKTAALYLGLLLGVVLLPDLVLLSGTKRQQRQLEKEVPYFLDLLTLTLQGGGNLEQALVATTNNYQSQLSQIVSQKLIELNWGRSLEAVLLDLSAAVKEEDFRHFLKSVIRAKKLGVSLSETLIIQVDLLRTRRRQKAEELSRTASVKISLPLVLFIFPALLIIYIGPGILQLLERT